MSEPVKPLPFELILKAQKTLSPILEKTPVIKSYSMSTPGQEVYLKMECLQRTGSFKVRGAFNKVASLTPEERSKGIIASSAGNHAQGVALGGQVFHVPTTICMPTTTPLAKIQNTRSYGANVILHGPVFHDAYAKAREIQKETHATFVHPFDDDVVIAGQGTVGLEMMEQIPDLDAIVVPIGGGGLIAGVMIAAKHINPKIKIIGVQAKGAAAMHESLKAGHIIELAKASTIADGIQVRRPGDRTFELCNGHVDLTVTVEEADLHNAILYLLEKHHVVSEGAGASPVAAYLSKQIPAEYKKVCLLVSGGNIDVTMVSRLIDRGLLLQGRRVRFETMIPDVPGSLAKFTALLGEHHANIYSIEQTRQKHSAGIMMQIVDAMIETSDMDHKSRVMKALADNDYKVTEL